MFARGVATRYSVECGCVRESCLPPRLAFARKRNRVRRTYRVHRVSEETIIVEADNEEVACHLAEEIDQHAWTFDIVRVYAEEIAEDDTGKSTDTTIVTA